MVHELVVRAAPDIVKKLKDSYIDVYEVGDYYVVLLPYAVVDIEKETYITTIYGDTVQDIYTAVAFLKTLKINVEPALYFISNQATVEWFTNSSRGGSK